MINVSVFRSIFFASIFSLFAWGQCAHAVVIDINQHEGYVEYLGVTGVLKGRNAPFRMLVPDDWNRQLIVYARGTGSATKLKIIVDENEQPAIVPELDPSSGLPILGVTPLINVPGKPPGDNSENDQLEADWLARGFALVASDYKPDPRFIVEGKLGWVVEDGIQDTLEVTRQARRILLFWSNHHRLPNRTLLIGRSQGSAIALKINETKPWLFNGIITGCTVGAGTPRVWDIGLGFALAFDAAFGWENTNENIESTTPWGNPEGGDIPVTLDFEDDVVPTLVRYLSNPANYGLFEFIRLVNGLPYEGFYPPGNPNNPIPGKSEFNWLFSAMLFLTEVRADLEGPLKANGRVAQNIGHCYALSDQEKDHLANLGVNADVLLAKMNDTVVEADPQARQYAQDFAGFTGKLRRPVISMHTWSDGLVIPENESALADTVAYARKSHKLLQVYTPGFGHCSFTPDQWIANVDAMSEWLSGRRPDPSDPGLFPPPGDDQPWIFPLSAEGFINDFEPGPWPQPRRE